MKSEKEIAAFFSRYAGRMLPEDGERFMKDLERKIDRLPTPSAFHEPDTQMSREYGRRLLEKVKKDYGRSKRDAWIFCLLAAAALAAVLPAIRALGASGLSAVLTAGVLAAIALIQIGFLSGIAPFHTGGW